MLQPTLRGLKFKTKIMLIIPLRSLSGEIKLHKNQTADVEPRLALSLINNGFAKQAGPAEEILYPLEFPHAALLYSKGIKNPADITDKIKSTPGLGNWIHANVHPHLTSTKPSAPEQLPGNDDETATPKKIVEKQVKKGRNK